MSPVSQLRFVRSELRLLFGRRRNEALLVILALVPVLIGIAVKVTGPAQHAGSIFGSITDNGLFAALSAFLVAQPLFIPLVISVVAGDSVAGEANTGTLRYLLVVPVGRTRLLGVKFTAVLVWCVVCALVVAVIGVLAGLALFPAGDLTLLSGRSVSYADGLGRLAAVTGYVAISTLIVGAIGLFVSTMTEVPLAAMAATLTLTIVSEVADAVPQLSSIHGGLPTHYWMSWVDLLRDPIPTGDLRTGLVVAAIYIALFVSLAWARLGGKDVTS